MSKRRAVILAVTVEGLSQADAARRYEVSESDEAGNPTRLMALAEQKRMAFKEQVTFFTDETRSRPVFGFRARAVMDLGAGYDITDEAGQQIGFFRKDFGASLLRTTFHVEGPGYQDFEATHVSAEKVVKRVRVFGVGSSGSKTASRRTRVRTSSIQAFFMIMNIQLSSRVPGCHWSRRRSARSTAS